MSERQGKHQREKQAAVKSAASLESAAGMPVSATMAVPAGARVTTAFALLRPANAITAGADSLAGFLIAGGDLRLQGWDVVHLIVASMALYAGGVVLNDVADAPTDAISRPERAIPAGILSRAAAAWIGAAFLAFGLGEALSVGIPSGVVAGACILAILLYDLILRRTPLAPVFMGTCRACNLALGMSAVGGLATGLVLPVVILWAYVSSLTIFAHRETGTIGRDPLIVGSVGMIGATAATIFLIPWSPAYGLGWLALVGLAVAWVARLGWRTMHAAQPASVQLAVKWLVLGVVGLDALMAGAARGFVAGLIVLAFLIPGTLLARRFSVA